MGQGLVGQASRDIAEAAEPGLDASHPRPHTAGMGLPVADWVILAGLGVVILLTVLWARRHPKVPPGD